MGKHSTKESKERIKISVRILVEFIMRSGDIDSTGFGVSDVTACQEGTRIHKKIQKSKGSDYLAEVPLSIEVPLLLEGEEVPLCIEGRADGIVGGRCIDEIKGMYLDVERLEEPFMVHLAQAKCYAYIYAKEHELEQMEVMLTYCNIETEVIRYFTSEYSFEELSTWFFALIKEYEKWASWQYQWKKRRKTSIQKAEFPFPYREGQKEFVTGVYRTILRKKKLYVEAPTGVGKTISTVFPAVKAMGEGEVEKIFYLTAKTIARTVAEDTFSLLKEQGVELKTVTITAKEKICIHEKCNCNPRDCERAKGHFDRVNDAVFDLLTSGESISREQILEYAGKHRVCPFEMCLDTTNWADVVICDYNYVFDPNAHLRRFFSQEKKQDFVFLIDEAHNLVERARGMYSARLAKEDFLEARQRVKHYHKKLEKALSTCNHDLLGMKRDCEDFLELTDINLFVFHLMQAMSYFEEFLQMGVGGQSLEDMLTLYFDMRHFLSIYEEMDDHYVIYTDYENEKGFGVTLNCMDPSKKLRFYLDKGKSAIFFSATLLPIHYYKEQLGGEEDDYAIYVPSPFDVSNRLLMIAPDIQTKYSSRNEQMYRRIAHYIEVATKAKKGNYFVFFSSYQMIENVYAYMKEEPGVILYLQRSGMKEEEKEEFLSHFLEPAAHTQIGFCVMGGIFGEGIDLKHDSLIGAIVVGTGLPMVCNERELFRRYYQEKKGAGFEYAYLYNGMNKVLQSAGRVIRTAKDQGVILLLDERFTNPQYTKLFPREWFPNQLVREQTVQQRIEAFWREKDV
ncbi:MAG: excision repair protein [Clostridiales bacterium]|nr:excision repair protein [Clostridiales bacterium]